nr:unnamed protein product [Callosobruchus chinensis]
MVLKKTKEWVSGIVSNMARKPSGGDTDQIYAVAAGEGDVAIVNSYYFARILPSEIKKDVIDKLGAFFPNRNDHGVMVKISGAAVTKNAKNRENAIVLLEFLVSKQAQSYTLKRTKNTLLLKALKLPIY